VTRRAVDERDRALFGVIGEEIDRLGAELAERFLGALELEAGLVALAQALLNMTSVRDVSPTVRGGATNAVATIGAVRRAARDQERQGDVDAASSFLDRLKGNAGAKLRVGRMS
jgi:hypothetical protein